MRPSILVVLLFASTAASATRLPLQMDFDRCTLAAENRSELLQGRARLELLVRRSGAVYAAFVHSASGIEQHPRFLHCLANAAVLWELPAVATDYQRPYVLSFVHGGADIDFSPEHYQHGDSFNVPGRTSTFMPDINDPAPLVAADAKLAQDTLEVRDGATDAERGTALLAVGDPARAIPVFRAALGRDANDALALRGLAHALAATGGDLKEARALANQLVELAPQEVSGHEALLHVCLAAKDDACAVAQFRAAKAAPDLAIRSRALALLQEDTRAAAARLAGASRAAAADPCADQPDEASGALCAVRRCVDEGTVAFARELSAQNHVTLVPGDWSAQRVGEGRYLVKRAIAGGGERHDALWIVTIASELTMKPASGEARQITLRHSRCAPRTLGSR